MRRVSKAVRWWFTGWEQFAGVAGGCAEDLVAARQWRGR